MKKETIQNRKGEKVVVVIEKVDPQKGLAFVMHGLGGYKEQPHIQAIAEAFEEKNYTVVRFDATHSLGESDGKYEDATITNYYEDLEDVIRWAASQEWYQEPFVLAGHSLGGISVALFAEHFSDKVKAVAPISTVVSGELSVATHKQHAPEEFEEWEKTGWLVKESGSKPGVIKRLKWAPHIPDRLKYNLLPNSDTLAMPVLLIVGENDMSTPAEHQKMLYDALPGQKELHIIKGAPHTFRNSEHLEEVKRVFERWIEGLS